MDDLTKQPYKIVVAGTGYVGMSLAVLLAQYNHVVAVDIVKERVDKINHLLSPVQDEYIERYLAEKELDLTRQWMVRRHILQRILSLLPRLPIMTLKRIFLIQVQWKM